MTVAVGSKFQLENMLQAVLIISSSGLVLFSKSFTHAGRGVERMVGALLRTVSALSDQVAGSLRYLEFENSCVYLANPLDAPVAGALFFDREGQRDVGLEFGHALAGRLLTAFIDDYGSELEQAVVGAHALGSFKEIGYRIPSILREATRGQLQQCERAGVQGQYVWKQYTGLQTLNKSSNVHVFESFCQARSK